VDDAGEAPRVRLAAGRALAALDLPPEARAAIARRSRIEPFGAVRDVLLEASAPGPSPLARGNEVLSFRIDVRSVSRGILVDVGTPDGAWRRLRALPSGEVFVPGVPGGVAEVRLGVEDD
ncbi:MAG: hypothetical protein AAGH15_08110, partial [Myxococcota bacterium]